jgi:hypothetical protein
MVLVRGEATMTKILHLHLKAEYFELIKRGVKPYEFRLVKPYWTKRLAGEPQYTEVWLYRAYEPALNGISLLKRGFEKPTIRTIQHDHFGPRSGLIFGWMVNGKGKETMPEKWKTIDGYKNRYEISNRGRIRSWGRTGSKNARADKPRILKPSTIPGGYKIIRLYLDGIQNTKTVRSLAREYWGGVTV